MKAQRFNEIARGCFLSLTLIGSILIFSTNVVVAEMVAQDPKAGEQWCHACGRFIKKESNDPVFRDSAVSAPVKSGSDKADKGRS